MKRIEEFETGELIDEIGKRFETCAFIGNRFEEGKIKNHYYERFF